MGCLIYFLGEITMEKYVNSLILELTRRCNASCEHCLRGDAQNIDMDFETAVAAIDQFDAITSITFTGGEPTLCGELIEKIVNYIIEKKKNVSGFYIASNAMKVDMQSMIALSRLYAYIYDNYGADEYQCVFDISCDQFHEDMYKENRGILHAFSFVSERGHNLTYSQLISEGRAEEYGIGTRYLEHNQVFNADIEKFVNFEMVYVNAKGNIFPDCNFSYNTQDSLPQVNIKTGDIVELTAEYNSKLCHK